MPFEFTLLDALQALRCPVLDALAVFFDQAGARGEIWIAFTAVLLAFRRTRRAGLAMALALPDEQADARLGHALRRMPVLFLLTLANLFRLRGTKDKFIHTEHTGAGSEVPGNNTGNRP